MNGILIIDKPAGWTSHDVVNKARRILQEKKIGHTGTLDPLATGVLVLCVGKATRIVRYLESDYKAYTTELRLGITTDTLDSQGTVLETREYTPPSLERVKEVLAGFQGVISQRPPAYSALKVSGVPSYRLARQGTPPKHDERTVTIASLNLLEYKDPLIKFSVHCSKGTYVRTLCDDIGERLGMGAHLTSLIRTQAGQFTLDQAIGLEGLTEMVSMGRGETALISPDKALPQFLTVTVDPSAAERIAHGSSLAVPSGELLEGTVDPICIMGQDGQLLAVARVRDRLLKPETVLI
jgi:tRNA pseudouridine55 synthase